jgi:hypothetical protein
MLLRLRGINVHPDSITVIPVHKCAGLGVTLADECAVFNHPSYWKDMPVEQGAAVALAQLRQDDGRQVFLFTHRPWPDCSTFPEGSAEDCAALWEAEHPEWREQGKAITSITEKWLSQHGIPYDRLVIEGAVSPAPDDSTEPRDRFGLAERGEIRVFVEDDPGKAKRMADLCERVLLFDQPYNRCDAGHLPNNLVRVQSWHEAYEYICEVF